jgi:agmatine deiminase
MPAEWEPHTATWLTWPHNLESWPDAFGPIPAIWVELVRLLAPGEHVHILVNDDSAANEVHRLLAGAGVAPSAVSLHLIPSNDAWMRDHGPTFLTRRTGPTGPTRQTELAAVDWIYNAWGGKYPPFDRDAAIAAQVAALAGARRFEPGIVLEGGSIEVNGCGTVLTTEACLLNPNRNPNLDRGRIEGFLRDYLGVSHVLWLGDGIVGDDTDGHIDDLARFADPQTVVTVVEDDARDENYDLLQENLRRLHRMTDQDGRPLRVVELPMPGAVYRDGRRLPASYANFYIANEVVVVPVFDDPMDEKALAVLQELFPSRRVHGIGSRDLVWGLGAFHCITQQQPAS